MNAAETSASSAIADWTLLTVVPRSSTTAEIDTFIIDVSITSTNIAIDSSSGSSLEVDCASGTLTLGDRSTSILPRSFPRGAACARVRTRRRVPRCAPARPRSSCVRHSR